MLNESRVVTLPWRWLSSAFKQFVFFINKDVINHKTELQDVYKLISHFENMCLLFGQKIICLKWAIMEHHSNTKDLREHYEHMQTIY